jgi:hypothetical protein
MTFEPLSLVLPPLPFVPLPYVRYADADIICVPLLYVNGFTCFLGKDFQENAKWNRGRWFMVSSGFASSTTLDKPATSTN